MRWIRGLHGLVVIPMLVIAACSDVDSGSTSSALETTATSQIPGTTTPSADPWTDEEVSFDFGGDQLAGRLTLPSRPGPHPAIVVVHGSGYAGVSSRYYTHHARAWAAQGYGTLVYDPPGSGGSEGTTGYQTLVQRRDEVVAAVRLLQARDDISFVGLWGESQGGWVIAMAAADYPDEIAFIISVSGSGVSVADQQIYSIETESRAAGFTDGDVAKAGLIGRLLVDWQLIDPVFQQTAREAAQDLGPGPWDDFVTLVYEPGAMTAAENLQAGIGILTSIQDEPWAEFLRLRDLYIPGLQSIPPEQADLIKAITGPDLIRNPGETMTRVRCPVLAFFGENDIVQPTERSAALYAQYLAEAGNQDVEIVVIPGVGHGIDLSIPEYADALSDWLVNRFAG